MKKLFVACMLSIMTFGAISTSLLAEPLQQHLTKSGKPDKRFKENKTPKGPVTKSGKPDMR